MLASTRNQRKTIEDHRDDVQAKVHDMKNSLLALGLTIELLKRSAASTELAALMENLQGTHSEFKNSIQELADCEQKWMS